MMIDHKSPELLAAPEAPAPLCSYRMDIAYIGTRFTGFQAQQDKNAIQDHLERALQVILGHTLRIRGASRTDSGVHAEHQVATFRTMRAFRNTWISGINAHLPPEIRVYCLQAVDEAFHPIRDARAKAYRYRLWKGKCFDPFCLPYVWGVHQDTDWQLFAEAARLFVGRHDFAGFRNQGSSSRTTVRTIMDMRVVDHGALVDFWVQGDGFLKQMVRIIVGTLAHIAHGKAPLSIIEEVFASGQRVRAGLTAPADGLSLVEIFYEEIPELDTVIARAGQGFTLGVARRDQA
jgi:tRNA pseudouridine38-40 synthase